MQTVCERKALRGTVANRWNGTVQKDAANKENTLLVLPGLNFPPFVEVWEHPCLAGYKEKNMRKDLPAVQCSFPWGISTTL